MAYIDSYLLPVPTDKLEQYRALADQMAGLWIEHGALSITEAKADDAPFGTLTSFPRAVQLADGETVICAYATYRDRAHRDAVVALSMADPRMKAMDMSFIDGKRMIWGGFEVIVHR